ncbi:hypothetical protein ACQHGV_13060 [Sphingomonas pseudosanguinis]|uniref:hypothetical protein n=1 Tax=Sphingomonas pseudosanguinis TaxID=413712 RepID=UPI003F836F4A
MPDHPRPAADPKPIAPDEPAPAEQNVASTTDVDAVARRAEEEAADLGDFA